MLFTEGEPIKREEEEKLDEVGYDDIGVAENKWLRLER